MISGTLLTLEGIEKLQKIYNRSNFSLIRGRSEMQRCRKPEMAQKSELGTGNQLKFPEIGSRKSEFRSTSEPKKQIMIKNNIKFKSPTTPASLMPTKSERVDKKFTDKNCLERYANQKHYLGNINKEWKKVTFIIWSGNKGKSGSIEILNKKGAVVLGINFKKNTVEFKNVIYFEFKKYTILRALLT